ncbi:MAG: type II secretion system protein [Betaproteobacteria bacterium]|nr:type II secretion system protein [Betaproteobacteria bacterium]
MNSKNAGFTLIELVLVIVILGILSAVALPQFINLRGDAQTAATNSVAGAISSAMTVNYSARLARNVAFGATSAGTVPVDNCDDAATTLQGGLPANYTTTNITALTTTGQLGTCTLTGPNSTTATFSIIGT